MYVHEFKGYRIQRIAPQTFRVRHQNSQEVTTVYGEVELANRLNIPVNEVWNIVHNFPITTDNQDNL